MADTILILLYFKPGSILLSIYTFGSAPRFSICAQFHDISSFSSIKPSQSERAETGRNCPRHIPPRLRPTKLLSRTRATRPAVIALTSASHASSFGGKAWQGEWRLSMIAHDSSSLNMKRYEKVGFAIHVLGRLMNRESTSGEEARRTEFAARLSGGWPVLALVQRCSRGMFTRRHNPL